MAFVIKDRVRESSTTTGTGAIALGGAPNTAYQAFSAVMSIGDTCWYAMVLPGTSWETGIGTYTSLNTLTRTTVIESSNANAAVSFGVGPKDVFMALPASKANIQNNTFPSGTLMLFQQTAAPIYWTKQTTHNDKALRVVSGTASSGGTNAFSTVMAQTVVGNTTPSTPTMASHNHPSDANSGDGGGITGGGAFHVSAYAAGGNSTMSLTGGGSAHNHTILMAIQYVDLIIASKD